jgi:hypothetical protein
VGYLQDRPTRPTVDIRPTLCAVQNPKDLRRAHSVRRILTWEDYLALASTWRDQVANVRLHETTRERPLDRFEKERLLLRPLPAIPFDSDEVVPVVVSPHARIAFDGKRYSVPPQLVRKPLTVRGNRDELRLLHEGQVVAQHVRSYQRGQLLVLPEHRAAALTLRQPPHTHALELATYDAACVENLLLAERRRRQLPTPTRPTPKRRELMDDSEREPADPALYDRFCKSTEENEDTQGTS